MKWMNCKDALPADGEEVLLRDCAVYHLAKFEKQKNQFVLRTGESISVTHVNLQWMRLSKP